MQPVWLVQSIVPCTCIPTQHQLALGAGGGVEVTPSISLNLY